MDDSWIDKVRSESLARLEAVSQMQQRLGEVTGEASSPDGLVRVRTTPSGALVDLHISTPALQQGADSLARHILGCAARAAADAAAQVHAIVGDVLPPDQLDGLLSGSVPASSRRRVEDELRARRSEAGA